MTEATKAGAGNTGQGRSGAGSSQLQQHCTTIYFRGKPVMEVRGGVAYRKAGRGERLRKPEGWSFHESVIAQLQQAGTRRLVIEDVTTGVTYVTEWPTFAAKSFALDRGAGPQRALPLSYWRVVHGLAAVTGWQQPSLFDVEGGGIG